MFITEGPVSIVSAQKTGDISSPFSVPLPATSNAQASHTHLPRPPNLWSCEYKLIASSNFATASAYCWDTAKRLACAGERRGGEEGERKGEKRRGGEGRGEEGREEEGRGGEGGERKGEKRRGGVGFVLLRGAVLQ